MAKRTAHVFMRVSVEVEDDAVFNQHADEFRLGTDINGDPSVIDRPPVENVAYHAIASALQRRVPGTPAGLFWGCAVTEVISLPPYINIPDFPPPVVADDGRGGDLPDH